MESRRHGSGEPLVRVEGRPEVYRFDVPRVVDLATGRMIWIRVRSPENSSRPLEAGLVFLELDDGEGLPFPGLAREGVSYRLRDLPTRVARDYFRLSDKPSPALSDQQGVPFDFPLIEFDPEGVGAGSHVFRITETIKDIPFNRDIEQEVKPGRVPDRIQVRVPIDPGRAATYILSRATDRRRAVLVFHPGYPWPVYTESNGCRSWLLPEPKSDR